MIADLTTPPRRTMKPGFCCRRLFALLIACTPLAGLAQVHLANLVRGSNTVTFVSQGGNGPYVVRTSTDLARWSDQGDPETRTNWTLSAFGDRGFHRVVDLNAADRHGDLFGLVQTEQGEVGELLARHRLKTRLWLYKTRGAPHTSATYQAADYWGKLVANLQTHWSGEVQTWTGALEDLGRMAPGGSANHLTITWTNGSGPAERIFTLALDFPYSVTATRSNGGATAPHPSDPTMTLRCAYATAQPELDPYSDPLTMTNTTLDTTTLVQLDPGNPTNSFPEAQNYRVSLRGVEVHLHFREGLPLYQGSPPLIFKTYLLDRWLAPTTAGGGGLPAFSTDSYFSRTLKPGHHNFFEIVLLEPALDPALSDTTRRALATANIRYLYTFKDLAIGMSPDDIRYIGFDNTVRSP